MKIKITQDVLQEAIRVISRLAPPITGNVTIESTGKKLFMHSSSELNRCSINLPCDVEGKPCVFALDILVLKDATKGRKEMEILFDKTMCKISAGAFKIDLPTVDALERETEKEEDTKAKFSVTAEQASGLKSALNTVALKPTALISTYMPVYIKLGPKGAFITCYDNNHLAFMNTKDLQGDMEVGLPFDVMSSVLDTFDKAAFTLSLGSSSLNVANKLVKVSLSLPQEEDGALKGSDVLAKAKEVSKIDGKEVIVSKTNIVEFLDNARAIATKERSEVIVTTTKGKVKLEVNTVNGNARALLKAEVSKESVSRIDFEFFDEAVRKSTEEVTMKIVDGAFISFKIKAATVLISLNQD